MNQTWYNNMLQWDPNKYCSLTTYKGHDRLVYEAKWSPFLSSCFASVSGTYFFIFYFGILLILFFVSDRLKHLCFITCLSVCETKKVTACWTSGTVRHRYGRVPKSTPIKRRCCAVRGICFNRSFWPPAGPRDWSGYGTRGNC